MRKIKAVDYKILVRVKEVEVTDKEEQTVVVNAQGMVDIMEKGFVVESMTKTEYSELKERSQEATIEAYVMDIGELCFWTPSLDRFVPSCKVGDLVLIKKFSGEMMHGLETEDHYRMITDRDIQGVFPDESIEVDY